MFYIYLDKHGNPYISKIAEAKKVLIFKTPIKHEAEGYTKTLSHQLNPESSNKVKVSEPLQNSVCNRKY